MHLVVQPDGSVAQVVIDRSTGYRGCDMAARAIALTRTYEPVTQATPLDARITPAQCVR